MRFVTSVILSTIFTNFLLFYSIKYRLTSRIQALHATAFSFGIDNRLYFSMSKNQKRFNYSIEVMSNRQIKNFYFAGNWYGR